MKFSMYLSLVIQTPGDGFGHEETQRDIAGTTDIR